MLHSHSQTKTKTQNYTTGRKIISNDTTDQTSAYEQTPPPITTFMQQQIHNINHKQKSE